MKYHDLTILNRCGIASLNTLSLHAKEYYSNLLNKHTANHIPNTKGKFRFTVSVLTYAMCTYNNIRKQDTELSTADDHIM